MTQGRLGARLAAITEALARFQMNEEQLQAFAEELGKLALEIEALCQRVFAFDHASIFAFEHPLVGKRVFGVIEPTLASEPAWILTDDGTWFSASFDANESGRIEKEEGAPDLTRLAPWLRR